MCIALFSTAHPDYGLIVLNNRDEFLARPTLPLAHWSSPHQHVLGGRDLARPERGTWLAVTSDGRIAVLTNVREADTPNKGYVGARSRGLLVGGFVEPRAEEAVGAEEYARGLFGGEGMKGVGGFSLVCGKLGERLAVVSNRSGHGKVDWILGEEPGTVGLSNGMFGDRSWRKVGLGEEGLNKLIQDDVNAKVKRSKEDFIEDCLEILSRDTLRKMREGESWGSFVHSLRESIFIPVVGSSQGEKAGEELGNTQIGASGLYGTHKQTVILIDRKGIVTVVERTLSDEKGNRIGEEGKDRRFDFQVIFSSEKKGYQEKGSSLASSNLANYELAETRT